MSLFELRVEQVYLDKVEEARQVAEILKECLISIKEDEPAMFANGWEMDGTLAACQKIIDSLEKNWESKR